MVRRVTSAQSVPAYAGDHRTRHCTTTEFRAESVKSQVAKDQRPVRICPATAAFDTDKRGLEHLAAAGKAAGILPRPHRKEPRDDDPQVYREWHLIENFFAKLKQFRAITTRYHSTARSVLAAMHLAATILWLN